MTLNDIVEKYIALRDKKAELVAQHKAEVAKIDELLDKAEATLLKTFQEAGLESVRTSAGTAYRTTRSTASVADWDAFFEFCQEKQLFDLIGHHCRKEAVAQYLATNDELPPGINWREEAVVNVRR